MDHVQDSEGMHLVPQSNLNHVSPLDMEHVNDFLSSDHVNLQDLVITATDVVFEDEVRFWACLRDHYKEESINLGREQKPNSRWTIGHKRIDPHQLFLEVIVRGGFEETCLDRKNWWEIAGSLGIGPGSVGTLSFQTKLLYFERLYSFEVALSGMHSWEVPFF
ncbi:Chromatin structure-remodeling complex protein rsc9 [Myotisia sp. PD_48]|nr:Chromatin structure-remodeling complex protein rsc9 [Myotisia sp. PD_48]